jgi:small subunit ribosomal protein S20
MPHTRTAKKRLRQNLRRREENRARRGRMRTEVRRVLSLVDAGKAEEAAEKLGPTTGLVDKAAKRNLIHPNKASRIKSKLAKKTDAASKK